MSPICSFIRPQKLPMHALSQQQARLDMDCRIPGSLGLFGCRREGQAPGPATCVQNGPLCHLGLLARPDCPLPLRGFLPSWQSLMHPSLNRSEQTGDPVLTSSTASSGMRQARSSFVNLPSIIDEAPFHPWPAAGRNRAVSRFRIGCAEYGIQVTTCLHREEPSEAEICLGGGAP